MRVRLKCVVICMAGLAPFAPAFGQASPPAQTPPATPAPAPAPAPAPVWSVGGIDFSGLVDGYYSLNFNHPATHTNQLYNFDVRANEFSLSMAKLSASHTADPVGFQLDLGFGRAFDMVAGGEQQPSIFRNIEQAYVTLKPPKGKGFQVDFGKFVTTAGAEVIEAYPNWNYSRSLLFAWAIPYYHFGVRTSIPVGSHFTGGFQLVNGWNNVEDNNSGKTIGLVGAVTTKKVTWTNDYYAGPENAGTNKGWRQLYDTTFLLTPSDKASAYINFDYGQNAFAKEVGPTAAWYGVAFALHLQATAKSAITPRIEWFKDRNGFSTGTAQTLKEFTITYEYKMPEGLLARAEYRRDWSSQPFFDRGTSTGVWKNQDTLALGIVAFFGPKR